MGPCTALQVRPLEMFFPFDPYLLRRSARFLDLPSSYNTWAGGHQHDADASHLSSDDELEVPEGQQDIKLCWSNCWPFICTLTQFCKHCTHRCDAQQLLMLGAYVP